jgi:hypothetical protein
MTLLFVMITTNVLMKIVIEQQVVFIINTLVIINLALHHRVIQKLDALILL